MKIGIIGAMDLEIKKLTTEEMTSAGIVEKAGMKFHVGRLGDTDVVIVKSGVGKVNAAICAQILVNCFDVTHLINTGIAGSLDHNINIGDIVVSEDAMYHDMDVTVFGYEPGVIPQMGTPNGLKSFPADPGKALPSHTQPTSTGSPSSFCAPSPTKPTKRPMSLTRPLNIRQPRTAPNSYPTWCAAWHRPETPVQT